MITLYNKTTKDKLAYLDDIIIEDTIEITRKINGEFTLKFEALEANLKSEYFESETYISVDGYYFDIAYIEQVHSDKVTYRIECEHVTYRLINDTKQFYTYDGTPAEILADVLSGTDFTVGNVDSTDVTTFAVYEEINKLGLIQLLANKLNLEIDYGGYSISLKNTIGQDRGFQARFGKNLLGVKKIIDKRKGLTYYSVDIVEFKNHTSYEEFSCLEVIEEGDIIQIIDEIIGLNVTNKVISRTYSPIKSINTSLEIANSIELLTDTVTQIRRETVSKDKIYNGIRISPTNGFESIRSDNKARGVFNSDIFALQSGDGTGENWINKIYFDADIGKYVFDGELSADVISALSAVITPNIYAEKATIAEITVDQLETGSKVRNYLNGDTSDVNYIKIKDQYLQFITASTDGLMSIQATDRNGVYLYWNDDMYTSATTDETAYPVSTYEYTELIKAQLAFDETSNHIPQLILGAGSGNTANSGKTFIYKATDGFYIDYRHSLTGESTIFKITDGGIDLSLFPTVTYSENVVMNGIPQIWVQDNIPTAAKAKDLWVDTDDYTRYDKTDLTASTTLSISDNEVITASGTFTIALHNATTSGIIKKIYNVGTGIIKIAGTINGVEDMYIYPNESVELITDGSGWRL